MRYWILQMNPTVFSANRDYSSSRKKSSQDWWGIRSFIGIVAKGDTAFIWHSIDRRSRPRKPRGVYAFATVLSVPPHKLDAEKEISELKNKD